MSLTTNEKENKDKIREALKTIFGESVLNEIDKSIQSSIENIKKETHDHQTPIKDVK